MENMNISKKILALLLIFVILIPLLSCTADSNQNPVPIDAPTTDGKGITTDHNSKGAVEDAVLNPADNALIHLDTKQNSSLRFSVALDCTDVTPVAIEYLISIKEALYYTSEHFGFTQDELLALQLGNPFTIYLFDKELNLSVNDVFIFPILLSENIVGILEVWYDAITGEYLFTFGKSYSEGLNSLRYQRALGSMGGLAICSMGSKLFATNGNSTAIFFDRDYTLTENTNDLIRNSASFFMNMAEADYVDATKSIDEARLVTIPTPITSETRASNPIPIPYVAQQNVCGVAAWASVLNYRFATSYSDPSLESVMKYYGYWNYTDPDDGTKRPTMPDYRNFTNFYYSAGVVYISSPPSFTTVKSAINAVKPIMGNWSTPDSSRKSGKNYHAIVIVGYYENTSNASLNYYHVRNPWYSYSQVTNYLSGSSVTYTDKTTTWTLLDAVY